MAFLFCNTRRMDLSPALANVGELKNVIANELQKRGFTDVINNQSEVAGNRNGVRLSVLHLFIGGKSFFEQVMAGGDTHDGTLGSVNEVVKDIQHLHFL